MKTNRRDLCINIAWIIGVCLIILGGVCIGYNHWHKWYANEMLGYYLSSLVGSNNVTITNHATEFVINMQLFDIACITGIVGIIYTLVLEQFLSEEEIEE